MDKVKEWWDRFTTWVKYEPVKASEQVRMLLLSLTAVAGVGANDPVLTAVMGAITALFSIYASKRTRDKVMPMERVTTDYEPKKIEAAPQEVSEDYRV